ncbi:MAG: polysaccharide biosynthesis tyrosine autokinase [Bacillota bacterium]|nr:polysaccharide biosynthesis tyrosine autokinase [Bacillota bacterium]
MEEELDLYAIWQVIVKRWKLIVLLPILAALASLLVSIFLITPQYTASTTLMLTRPTDTSQILYQDIQVSRQLVNTYREIIHSRRVLEVAIANRSLPYSVIELREKVDVQAVRDTELITVDVTDPDPHLARDIANELASAFMTEITEIMQIENVSVVDEAVLPEAPVSPRVKMNVAVAFVVGLMAAFGIAFLIEYLDRTIKDPEEAQKLLEIPVIGVVPAVEGQNLFTMEDPRSPASEAFRSLRTNIQYSSVDKPIKKILVAGANPSCGKSTITANLGVTMAQSGGAVLLIDADLRRPTLHKFFETKSEPGLTNLIFKEDIEPARVLRKTEHEKLYLMPSGPIPPYPAELLASERMKKLIEYFAERFDYIIFDSPPIIAVTDAAILSRLVDGTLLVLDYGRVRKEEAAGALDQLARVQANVIGAVINAVPQNSSHYDYHYYYYYGSSSDSPRKSRRKLKQRKKSMEIAES